MRNSFTLKECLTEAYVRGMGTGNAHIPDDPELPLLLNKVRPLHHIVKIDYFLPGCPPSADAFWHFLTELVAGRDPSLSCATHALGKMPLQVDLRDAEGQLVDSLVRSESGRLEHGVRT